MGLLGELPTQAMSLHARLDRAVDADPIIARITTDPSCSEKFVSALIWPSDLRNAPHGFRAYFTASPTRSFGGSSCALTFELPSELHYLADGDVIRLNPRKAEAWVMYRRSSKSNALFVTERCNSWCLMCSQPPKARNDDDLARAWLAAIPLMSRESETVGMTGGEPTLLGTLFFKLIEACKEHLPSTAVHVLSNGRQFNYLSFAKELAELRHPNLMLGIPLYSDIAWRHDFVVQAEHAFDQTIRGLLNLARCQVATEIRIVLHKQTIERLPSLARFIAANLPFVEHVAIMGLEPIGFAKKNLDSLWIDPVEYQSVLEEAVLHLAEHRLNVSIYNHQLCVLPRQLWRYARQSISDWKNVYLPECSSCSVREHCGGFFHSAGNAHSGSIRAIQSDEPETICN